MDSKHEAADMDEGERMLQDFAASFLQARIKCYQQRRRYLRQARNRYLLPTGVSLAGLLPPIELTSFMQKQAAIHLQRRWRTWWPWISARRKAARKIQHAWLSYSRTRVFHFYSNLIGFRSAGLIACHD